eukprot:gnl/Carplike_NY0171/3696_a4986_496.p1 GENE.gnl/Carplike_NY0171/3696_a4986_496~~gnl/Carplike_NY0171/3696_a4986_496.p1  ORF type:complete len:175 (+),score=7.02 gnl/Carplike_NY0171/3696_a4986_496:70-594(+)
MSHLSFKLFLWIIHTVAAVVESYFYYENVWTIPKCYYLKFALGISMISLLVMTFCYLVLVIHSLYPFFAKGTASHTHPLLVTIRSIIIIGFIFHLCWGVFMIIDYVLLQDTSCLVLFDTSAVPHIPYVGVGIGAFHALLGVGFILGFVISPILGVRDRDSAKEGISEYIEALLE